MERNSGCAELSQLPVMFGILENLDKCRERRGTRRTESSTCPVVRRIAPLPLSTPTPLSFSWNHAEPPTLSMDTKVRREPTRKVPECAIKPWASLLGARG